MKTKKLLLKYNLACLKGDKALEKKIWLQLLHKSLKHKKTYAAR